MTSWDSMLYVPESLDMKESFGNIWNQHFFLKLTSCVPWRSVILWSSWGTDARSWRSKLNLVTSKIWLWINTYENTIFRGMNIHKSQLFWCELQGYKVLTHCHMETWEWYSVVASIGNVQNDANVNLAETACFFSSARWSLQQCRRQMYPLRRIGNALNSWRRWWEPQRCRTQTCFYLIKKETQRWFPHMGLSEDRVRYTPNQLLHYHISTNQTITYLKNSWWIMV